MKDPKEAAQKAKRIKYLMWITKGMLLALATTSLIYPAIFLFLMRLCIFIMAIVLIFGKQIRQFKNKKKQNEDTFNCRTNTNVF